MGNIVAETVFLKNKEMENFSHVLLAAKKHIRITKLSEDQ